jgi:hypothetical protein
LVAIFVIVAPAAAGMLLAVKSHAKSFIAGFRE